MRPLDVLGVLRLEDGRLWTAAAHDFQLEDARAILDGDRPYHFLTRPRGGSKTTDLAGIALALLLSATERARLYWIAGDREQGQLAIDAVAGFVDRTPALRDAVVVTASAVEVRRTGARLDVLAADAASSWGLRPSAVFCDELCQWPDTPAPRQLWASVSSAVAKRDDATLVVLTTAGDPSHFAHGVLEHALGSSLWRVHEVPGPAPWTNAERLEEQRARLSESLFARLFLNRWTAAEDRLTTGEALRECVVLDGPLEYDPAFRYLISVDLGLKRDRTVGLVAHRDGRRIVMDRLATWQGSRAKPVQLEDVEEWLASTALDYGSARIVADPWQAVGLCQRLRGRGLAVEEYVFTAASVGRLAAALFNAIRDRAVALPPDEALLDELEHVRLRESSPGVFRLDHDAGRHDDQAVALGLAVTTLLAEPSVPDFGRFWEEGPRSRPHPLLSAGTGAEQHEPLWRDGRGRALPSGQILSIEEIVERDSDLDDGPVDGWMRRQW